jgi:hypothetical protein
MPVDSSQGLFYTNLEDPNRTIAVDIRTHAVKTTWNPGCGADGPRGIGVDTARNFVLVACTDGVRVLDGARDGALLGKFDTGAGVDNIEFVVATNVLVVAAGKLPPPSDEGDSAFFDMGGSSSGSGSSGSGSSSGNSGSSGSSSSGGQSSTSSSGGVGTSSSGAFGGSSGASSSGVGHGSSASCSGSGAGASSSSSSSGGGAAVTWTTIYGAYLGRGTPGNCSNCHNGTSSPTAMYSWLQGQGQLGGSSPVLTNASKSCLSWYGGNMPPLGPQNAQAVAQMNAWAAAGALDN